MSQEDQIQQRMNDLFADMAVFYGPEDASLKIAKSLMAACFEASNQDSIFIVPDRGKVTCVLDERWIEPDKWISIIDSEFIDGYRLKEIEQEIERLKNEQFN